MTSDRKQVAVWEATTDLIPLAAGNFAFQFAKSVIGPDGNLTFNMVWRSAALQPRTLIEWTPVYGLNWTLTIPAAGGSVTLGGVWQACALGQSYDITSYGTFVPSTAPGKQNFMNIGKNGYSYAGQTGIHIIVGLQNPSGQFDPIYLDTTSLGLNMSAWYQPQEKVQWWYEKGMLSSTMISGAGTTKDTVDMSTPNPITGLFYISTTYVYAQGVWNDSPYPPPQAAATGLLVPGSVNASIAGTGGGDPVLGGNSNGHTLQSTNQNLQTLQRKVNSLEGFLASVLENSGGDDTDIQALPFRFRGTVNWPATASILIITAGTVAIGNALINRGYRFAYTIDEPNKKSTITFGPSNGDNIADGASALGGIVPEKVRLDWNAAVEVESKNGARNGGVEAIDNSSFDEDTTLDKFRTRKLRAKAVLNGQLNGYAQGQTV